MSTYIYLTCRDHSPVIRANGESGPCDLGYHGEAEWLRDYGALNALIRYRDVPNGHAGPDEVAVLRPDIAAALGIEAVDHE